jgi:hypothetical protein
MSGRAERAAVHRVPLASTKMEMTMSTLSTIDHEASGRRLPGWDPHAWTKHKNGTRPWLVPGLVHKE